VFKVNEVAFIALTNYLFIHFIYSFLNCKIMAKSIKGTRTEKNLLCTFAGESQARMRYTYFAGVAKKEGYEQIAAVFTETADQEKEHAKRMFKFLEGGMVEFTGTFPAGVTGTTPENLKAAAAGEHEEWAIDYPKFADVAEEEGFPAIAAMYRQISIAEKGHEERYRALLGNIEGNKVFAKDGEVLWQCRNCGFIHSGAEAPTVCPACLHPQAYFEVKKENW
jgi:rubrerythrin